VFGVGPYSFAPWKVAISGLHKDLRFRLLGPVNGRPVVLDDACYFLPFDTEEEAAVLHAALGSGLAREFYETRIFWDAKRPITKGVLEHLRLEALVAQLGVRQLCEACAEHDRTRVADVVRRVLEGREGCCAVELCLPLGHTS
jgi:hypothetical protein